MSGVTFLASAIDHHTDYCSKIAALMFVCRKCIPDSNSTWLWFLRLEDPAPEQEIDRSVFQ